MGVKLTRYKAGSAANTVTQAWDSAVSAKPDAVIAAAIDVELWKSQLKQLQADNIPVVTTGILGTQKYGIKAAQAAEAASELEGKLMADYTASKFSDAKKIAIYDVPEDSTLPEMRPKQEKKAAYSYLSNIGGTVYRHRDWASCERRTCGRCAPRRSTTRTFATAALSY